MGSEMCIRDSCNRVQPPEESVYSKRDCDAYWGSDRTAGFRLAWLAEYSQAIRYGGDEGKKMALDDLQVRDAASQMSFHAIDARRLQE